MWKFVIIAYSNRPFCKTKCILKYSWKSIGFVLSFSWWRNFRVWRLFALLFFKLLSFKLLYQARWIQWCATRMSSRWDMSDILRQNCIFIIVNRKTTCIRLCLSTAVECLCLSLARRSSGCGCCSVIRRNFWPRIWASPWSNRTFEKGRCFFFHEGEYSLF